VTTCTPSPVSAFKVRRQGDISVLPSPGRISAILPVCKREAGRSARHVEVSAARACGRDASRTRAKGRGHRSSSGVPAQSRALSSASSRGIAHPSEPLTPASRAFTAATVRPQLPSPGADYGCQILASEAPHARESFKKTGYCTDRPEEREIVSKASTGTRARSRAPALWLNDPLDERQRSTWCRFSVLEVAGGAQWIGPSTPSMRPLGPFETMSPC